MFWLKALASLSLFFGSPAQSPTVRNLPTVDISAIRYIDCGDWVGSGFLIADKVMATALHVAEGKHCVDARTGGVLHTYKTDPDNDLALMTSDRLPTDIPYIKVGCSHFNKGEDYLAWGETPSGMDSWDNHIQRMNVIQATGEYEDAPLYGMFGEPEGIAKHVQVFEGAIAPGMSGGPVTTLHGTALGLNNAGSNTDTLIHEFADGILCKKT